MVPDPRLVLRTAEVHISRSMRKALKTSDWTSATTMTLMQSSIIALSVERGGREAGTWITEAMIDAYLRLHELGLAHPVEVRRTVNLLEASTVFCWETCSSENQCSLAGKRLEGGIHSEHRAATIRISNSLTVRSRTPSALAGRRLNVTRRL